MAYELSEKLKNLTPYTPLEGNYDIRLDANESFISLPQEILDDAMKEYDLTKINRYPDPYTVELCQAFGKHYDVHPDFIVAGNGSDELIGVILAGFFQPDDHLVTLSHDFSMYKFYADSYNIKNTVFQKDPETLRIDIDALISYINSNNAKGVIFSNPCNPTGLCLSREDAHKLITSVDALVILDEAYMDFADKSLITKTSRYDNLIILRTCSKALGLASIRLGFSVANATLTTAIRSLKAPYNVNTLTQIIGKKVYSKPIYLYECHARLTRARDHFRRSLMQFYDSCIIKMFDTSANFIFLRVTNAPLVHARLLERSIAVRLIGDCIRVTVGTIRENEAFLIALLEISELMKKEARFCELEGDDYNMDEKSRALQAKFLASQEENGEN